VPVVNEPGALVIEPTEPTPPRTRSLGRFWEQWGIALVLLVLAGVAAVVDPEFVSPSNIQSIMRESAYVGIAAAGMTLAIMNGTFDLSVGGQLALISSISLMGYASGGTLGAILAALAAGLACGLTNGLIITRLRVAPFVATLGTLFLFRGITYVLTQDGPKTLPYSEAGSAFVQIGSASVAGIPVPFILMILIYAASWVLLRRTVTGRRIIAFGSSPAAARFCGISADRIRLLVFTLVGLSVGIAALTFVTRVWTADGGIADGFELQVIAAVVLGGTSLKGGRGTLLGTFAAVLLLAGLNDFLVSQHVPASWQRIVLGIVLITALAIDGLRTGYARPATWRRLGRRRTEVMPLAK
jgi:ribose transport system permease protein